MSKNIKYTAYRRIIHHFHVLFCLRTPCAVRRASNGIWLFIVKCFSSGRMKRSSVLHIQTNLIMAYTLNTGKIQRRGRSKVMSDFTQTQGWQNQRRWPQFWVMPAPFQRQDSEYLDKLLLELKNCHVQLRTYKRFVFISNILMANAIFLSAGLTLIFENFDAIEVRALKEIDPSPAHMHTNKKKICSAVKSPFLHITDSVHGYRNIPFRSLSLSLSRKHWICRNM